ncbi:MAG: T9SS type A sorting domain-containing protein [bacterium]
MKHFITIIWLIIFFSVEKLFTQTITWESTGGPPGYEHTCVYTMAINSSGLIFASLSAGTGRGLWRSLDSGNSWTRVIAVAVAGLAINSRGDIFIGNPLGEGIWRSFDNGDTWTQINNGLPTVPSVLSLAINSDGYIYAGMSWNAGNVFRSTDNGETWTQVHPGLPSSAVDAIAFNSSGHIFAGNRNGTIFRSIDNGENWDEVLGLTDKFVVTLAINSNDHIFAGTWDVITGDGIFRSTDNGETWNPVNNGLATRTIQSLVINSDDHVFAGTQGWGVYRSTDNGETWKGVNSGLTNFDARSFALNPLSQLYLGTCRGGVFRTLEQTTQVDEKIEIPNSFVLYQNYPNPFNPSTTIRFSLLKQSQTTLQIFDVLGEHVATLLDNEDMQPGSHEVKWDANNMASGMYFYKVEARHAFSSPRGGFVKTKKMLLLR